MKKLVSVLFALLLIGSLAFAEDAAVKVGAWGRFIYVPAGSLDGADNVTFSGPSWASGSRVGVTISGTSDNVGFLINYFSNGNNLNTGDNASVWLKLNDYITLRGGKTQGDVLRGKIDDSDVLNAMPSVPLYGNTDKDNTDPNDDVSQIWAVGATGKDDIFKRFYPTLGLIVEVTPMEGVYFAAALDTTASSTKGSGLTEDAFKSVQVGAGYTIPNIGLIRAQYIGAVDEKTFKDDAGVATDPYDQPKYFQVAFAYTGMENLLVDAGLKYQTVSKAGQSLATVAATYSMDALSLLGRFQVGFGENGEDDKMTIKASADVGYAVADPLAIGSEVSFMKHDKASGFSVAPYGKMAYGNGSLKAAFVYSSFAKSPMLDQDTNLLALDSYTAWAIPIVLTYSF
jgi:hypothetical protein